MLRRVGLRRTGISAKGRTPISRGSAPQGVSAKRKSQRVRGRLRRASKKRRSQEPERTALLRRLKELVGHRCEVCWQRLPLDGHEIRKPRARYWLNPEYVILLCRPHHEMCEAAFTSRTGRLVITGTRSTGWEFYVPPKTSKFIERARPPFLNGNTNQACGYPVDSR